MLQKRNLLFLSLLIMSILLLSSCFLNPPVTEGIIKGQVMVPEGSIQAKDLTGQALSDATVNIIDLETGAIIATATTDANGYYQVSVPAGGPYLLEAVKDGVKLQQITPQVELGKEYDLGTTDCTITAAALIAQAMMDAGDNPADIDCTVIMADPNFDDVSSIVCDTIQAGNDPTASAVIEQAVEDFLYPPAPVPTPAPTTTPLSLSSAKAITAFSFTALVPEVVSVIDEGVKTITLTVPFGTEVTALVPTIVHTGVNVSPVSGTAQDFTSPVTYTVSAEDTSIQTYLVTVTEAVPAITTVSSIANGATVPSVTVSGTNFKTGITAADLTVGVGTTGLILDTVSFINVSEITIVFTGTAVAGEVIIQAKTSAFEPESLLSSNTLTVTVPAAVIDIAVIPGVIAPVRDVTPVTTITETDQYTGTVAWAPTDSPFAGPTIYVAWITLIPREGFTLSGVAANFFSVEGSTIVTNSTDSGVVVAVFPRTLIRIGDSYSGGKVAYILQSGEPGYDENVQHGLIAATVDQSAGIAWITGGSTQITWVNGLDNSGTSTDYGTGQANTNAMMAQIDYTGGAAQVCYDYTNPDTGTGVYSDWYLPSRDELEKLFLKKSAIDGFASGSYWSSSEYDASNALYRNFCYPFFQGSNNKSGMLHVRAVRYF